MPPVRGFPTNTTSRRSANRKWGNRRSRGKLSSRGHNQFYWLLGEGRVVRTSAMVAVNVSLKMLCLCFPLWIILLFVFAVPASGFNVVAEGSSATERTTDISLRCRVTGLKSEDEIVRVTWFAIDQSQRFLSEVFSADLTNDRPAFLFSADWAGRGFYDTSTMANVRLPARFVSRDVGGNYRCQVDSLMSSGFTDVKVNVLYGPGSSMIISPGGRVERREGEQLSLTCIAQCNPECSYRWYKAGRLVSSSQTMKIASLTRDQAGLYACQARNEAGRSIKPVDLRVSFPASVLNLNINSEGMEPSRDKSIQAYRGAEASKTVVFTCKVAAWPEPNIEWSNSNSYTDTANKLKVISTAEADLELKSSVLEIKSATCRDNGQYTCKARNSIGDPSFKTGILNISCAPFETNHLSNCSKGSEITIIKNLHTNLHVNLCFFGNPVPMATMTHINNKNKVMTTYTGATLCDFKLNLCNSSFEFNITSPEQYGEYVVKVINSQGHFEKRYNVSSQQPPLAPFMLIVSNISETSACLSWISNFNGGAKQTFSLKVYTAGKQKDENEKREFAVEEDDTKTSTKYSLCVFKLHPETHYDATLLVANRFGEAGSLRRVTFVTISSFNSTISIPSWLSVVQTTLDEHSGELPTISPGERIGKLILKEQPIEKLETSRNIPLKVTAAEVQHYIENSVTNVPGFGDERGKQFFQLLNVYFTFGKLAGSKGLKLWPKDDPGISNFSSNLGGKFIPIAKTEDVMSSSHPTTLFDLDNETTSSVIVSTSLDEQKSASFSSLSPVMLSIICIAITCVTGIIMSFACITVLKRQQMRSRSKKKYHNKDEGRHTGKLTTVNESQAQNSSRGQRNINGPLLQRVPSITCVYNENVFFTPQTARRPRLSTPDVNLFRQKETPVDVSEAREEFSLESTTVVPGHLPFITVDSMHGSCSSYLDLVHSELEAFPQHCQPSKCLQDNLEFPKTQQLQLCSASSQQVALSSVQQTHVKSLSDDEPDISSSYLDLYETLAIRSRSRSPSNIYNPLFCDVTSIKSTDSNARVQSNKSNRRERAMVVGQTDNPHTVIASLHAENNKNQHPQSKTDQIHPDWVQCRPKKTSLRVKLTRAPSVPRATAGAASESSYELVNVSSRKHLASYMYLPMISKVNSAFHENSNFVNYDSPEIDNIYEKPKCNTGFQPSRISRQSTRNDDNAYESRISTESTQSDSEKQPDVYSSHYQHYIDIDELSRRRNVNTQAFITQRERAVASFGSSYSDTSLLDNCNRHYETSAACISPKENNHESIYEGEDYVQEDTLSYINRDSVSTVSTTGTVSTYCNETDIRRSLQCSSGSDFDESRSRKSSSESDRGIKCSRKFSFDSDSTEHCFEDPLFECSEDTSPNCRRSSEDTAYDRRDSGVSFNCQHDRVCCRNGAMHFQGSTQRNLPGSSMFYGQTGSQQDLYEEAVIYEHIYAEVSS